MGSQTELIAEYYHELQERAEKYLENLVSFLNSEEETTTTLEKVENIRRLIMGMIDRKIREEVSVG